MSCFFFDFRVAMGAPWDGLTCNPYAPAQSKHTFSFFAFLVKIGSHRCYFSSILGAVFQKKCENEKVCLDCAGAYGLHMSPSFGALSVTKKLKKKSNLFQNPSFLQKKIFKKRAPKGVQKGEGISGVAPLGAPLEPQADF